jgi:hypothetical protein
LGRGPNQRVEQAEAEDSILRETEKVQREQAEAQDLILREKETVQREHKRLDKLMSEGKLGKVLPR